MAERGQTLSESELNRLKPIRGEGGKTWRAFCPFHGSDKQRSLRVDRINGRFQCFACEAWGYMDWAREAFRASKDFRAKPNPARDSNSVSPKRGADFSEPLGRDLKAVPDSFLLAQQLAAYQAALPGSLGEEYLADRKIPLALAQSFGVGYSSPGSWAHTGESGRPIRDWNFGRLVFPHTAPGGRLVNLYGRAIGDRCPKALRHDHLPGHKGYFNFPALESANANKADLFVCEGPFDALSIMAACPGAHAIAIFGVQGWHDDWPCLPRRIVLALDADSAGQKGWRNLARRLALRGKRVLSLPPEAFGGAKDANEAWVLGNLNIQD